MAGQHNLLFVCTGNSCRSQIAEAWARKLIHDRFEPFSAGIEPRRLDPYAVIIMQEAGIDISTQDINFVHEFLEKDIHYVVTLCDVARDMCPTFPRHANVLHHPFDNIQSLSLRLTHTEDRLILYRKLRSDIRNFVERLPDTLMRF
jgi:arsenate reductase